MLSQPGGINTNGLRVKLLNNSGPINLIMASRNKTPNADLHRDINPGGKRLTFGPRSTTKEQSQGEQGAQIPSIIHFGF